MNSNFEQTAYLLGCLMDNMTDHIYFKDLDSKIIMMNKAAAEWKCGFSPEEVVGKSDFDIFSHEHAQQAYDDEQEIIRTGKALYAVEERETWPDGSETWVSTTKMPLKNEAGEIIGTFGISRDITAHKEAELRLARYAKEVAHYSERLERINAEMEEDLRMAGELQKVFFPRSYPVFPSGSDPDQQRVDFYHYHHAGGLVGGDLCAVKKLSETEAGILMCDVMGHGVRAALGTAVIRTLVDDILRTEPDPGLCLERMNRALIPILRSGDEIIFATACYMRLDLADGTVRIANAGHPLPIRLTAEKAEWVEEVQAVAGPALAIMEEATFETCEIAIEPGQGVVMFTDGLYEVVREEDDEEYGPERMLESFHQNRKQSLEQLFPAVMEAADLFAGAKGFDDDVCLVGFRLKY